VSFSPDGKTIAAGSADDTAYVWDLASRTLLAALPHPGPVLSVTYGLGSDVLVTGGADGVARMWHLPSPVVTGFKGSVFTVAFSPDGRYLITASGDGLLQRFDVTSPSRPTPLGPPLTASGLDGTVAYGPGGRIAAGTGNGAIRLWNAANPNHTDALPLPGSALHSPIQYVTFDDSGRLMAAGSSAGEIELWNVTDIAHATPVATWSATSADPGADIFAVEFSPDDRLLASAGEDGTVRLWDIADLSHPRQIGPPLAKLSSAVYQVAFSPDGRILAASGADGKVRLWNVANPAHPRLVSTLSGPIGIVYDVSFSPDGHYLATANGDKTVAIWDIATPAEPRSMGILAGFSGTVFSVAFSPSGNAIAAGSQDNTVHLWLTNPDSAASYICSIAGDPITRAEWAHYVPGAPYNPPCGASR
jgi:WD40 repeat protein